MKHLYNTEQRSTQKYTYLLTILQQDKSGHGANPVGLVLLKKTGELVVIEYVAKWEKKIAIYLHD